MSGGDFDFEPSPGLPAPLPAGEKLLWQGAPDWRVLALTAFRVRDFAIYAGIAMLVRTVVEVSGGTGLLAAAGELLWPLVLSAIGLGLLAVIAWFSARATVYSLTERRVIIRQGIALPVTVNIPLTLIDGAALLPRLGSTGDISLVLGSGQRVSYLLLWPHVRSWRWRDPEPALRAVPDAAAVGQLVAGLLAKSAPAAEAPAAQGQRESSLAMA